jgi:hypothetical protein
VAADGIVVLAVNKPQRFHSPTHDPQPSIISLCGRSESVSCRRHGGSGGGANDQTDSKKTVTNNCHFFCCPPDFVFSESQILFFDPEILLF